MTNPELLTFAPAAQCLGVGVLTVRQRVRHDHYPEVRDGRAGMYTGGTGR